MRLKSARQLLVLLLAVVSGCLLLAASFRRSAPSESQVAPPSKDLLQMDLYSMGGEPGGNKKPSALHTPVKETQRDKPGPLDSASLPLGGAPPARSGMPLCPVLPDELGLVGSFPVNQTEPTWPELEARHPDVSAGGRWTPPACIARSRVAIVIPYRDRDANLRVFLQHMHPFLQRQKLEYGIFVAEPEWNNRTLEFNRGLMRNIGFMEAMKENEYDCAIFHDVDLLPENDMNSYACPDMPRHMCISLDYYDYKPIASGAIFGGIVAFRRDHFIKANGYSNLFFGWGGEDDDLYGRCKRSGIGFYRPKPAIGRYKGSPHTKDHRILAKNYRLWGFGKERWEEDGLTDLIYSVTTRQLRKLYTWILSDYPEDPYKKRIDRHIAKAAVIIAERKRNATLAGHNGTMPVKAKQIKKRPRKPKAALHPPPAET